MSWAVAAGEDSGTAQPATVQETPIPMTSPVTPQPLPVPVRLSQHEIVVARLSDAHNRGEHVSPLVACYECLHGEAPAFVTLRKAA